MPLASKDLSVVAWYVKTDQGSRWKLQDMLQICSSQVGTIDHHTTSRTSLAKSSQWSISSKRENLPDCGWLFFTVSRSGAATCNYIGQCHQFPQSHIYSPDMEYQNCSWVTTALSFQQLNFRNSLRNTISIMSQAVLCTQEAMDWPNEQFELSRSSSEKVQMDTCRCHATPLPFWGISPAELLMGRQLCTNVPVMQE